MNISDVDVNRFLSEPPFQCGECGIAQFDVHRTISHNFAISAQFRIMSCFPHIFAKFDIFRTFSHNLRYENQCRIHKISRFWSQYTITTFWTNWDPDLGRIGTLTWQPWDELGPWYDTLSMLLGIWDELGPWCGTYWDCDVRHCKHASWYVGRVGTMMWDVLGPRWETLSMLPGM